VMASNDSGDTEPHRDVHRYDVQRYEQLRGRALGGDSEGFRLGLAMLQHRGVSVWLRAWRDVPARTRPTVAARTVPTVSGGDQQLVAALASMVLACAAQG
jgi:hypothetical protein